LWKEGERIVEEEGGYRDKNINVIKNNNEKLN